MLRLLVLLIALSIQTAAMAAQNHSVLLIHSYHSGMPWTDSQHQGFVDALRDSKLPVDLHVEYLDTLRYRQQKDLMRENLSRTLLGKFKDHPPEVIAVSDNDALDFVLDERPKFAPNAAVVFCGINGLSPDIRSRYQNLTGVAEEASFKETLEVMETLLPGRRVLVLGEQSSTFRGNFGSLKSGNERRASPAQLEVFDDPVLSHIEARVRLAGPDTLVFILLRPINDAGETVDSAIAVRAISVASKQPVFSAWDYMFGYGIVGGKLISGEAHGQTAAQQVIRILKGEAADSIPFEWESSNRYMFDYEQLARFGLQNQRLPEGSIVINRPVSFYEIHRDKVLAAAAAFMLLLLLGVRLLVLNKSLRESRNLLDNIIDNIPVMVFLKRASDLSFVVFNRAGEALLGRNRGELLGRSDYDFFPKEQSDFFTSKDRDVLRQKDVVDIPEEPVATADGTRILHTRKLALRDKDGQAMYLLGISEDITDLKRNADELRRYRDHLEEEVQQRTTDLMLARDAAEAANRAKSVFLSNMSHELRTPLNAILGFSNMMRKDPQLQPRQREDLDIINRSGEHLLTLINDVLEMSKIESGRVQLESIPFDLGGLVRDVIDMMQIRAQEKGLRLLADQSSEFPRYIKGDEARLRQILINLVGNAVKYTRQGGVTVRFGMRLHAAQQYLVIEVEDSGVGIAPEDQQKIFEPFVQLGEQAAQKGTGLGLAITRQYVQLMRGTIGVESTVGRGSIFRVELPVERVEANDLIKPDLMNNAVQGEIVGLAPGQPDYRILIVEDQLDNQLLLTQLMQSAGVQVKVAEDGQQGVQLFQSWRPHLIWMDRRMPVMDGMEATKTIRRLPGGKDVKIVAVTASAFMEQRDEMLNAGMNDFVRKPYRANEIFECMARQLGLQYVYADTLQQEEAEAAPLTARTLSVLPPELRSELCDALESLDAERIAAAIKQVGAYDPAVQKALSRLVDSFDYPAILKALQTGLTE
ncbi:MAG: ATP-binding protein [Methylococcaceae bacterium]|nr:ATP-binding protein [Methylococcaceae bacterium]